jgi:hypothetical protein
VDASASVNEASAMHIEDNSVGCNHFRWMNSEWIGKIGGGGHGNTDAPIIIACHQNGIGAQGDFTFSGNTMHHAGGPGDAAYAFYASTNQLIIEDNEMYDLGGYAIQLYNGNTTPVFICSGAILRNNYIHDINRGATSSQVAGMILYGSNIRSVQVYNNIIDTIGIGGTATDGIGIIVGSGSGSGGFGHLITFNTVYNTLGALFDLGTSGESGTLSNNVGWTGGTTIAGGAGFTKTTNDINTGGANPGFVDAPNGNFHLVSGSRLRGAGTANAITTDKDGVFRGTPPDIGAQQFV